MWTPSLQLGSMNESALLCLCSGHTVYHPPTHPPLLLPSSGCPWVDLISLFFFRTLEIPLLGNNSILQSSFDWNITSVSKWAPGTAYKPGFVSGSTQCPVIAGLGSGSSRFKDAFFLKWCVAYLKSSCCSGPLHCLWS